MKQILSKLLIVFMLCVINCSSLFAQDTITIVNEKVGKFQKTVESKWKKEKKTIIPMSEVTHLCVEGIFDSNIDAKYLFQAFPNLEFLNLDKLNGTSISLNGALKLKELWAPSGCKYIATHEMPALRRLQIYCGTGLSQTTIIPFVYLKTADDIEAPDFNSPLSEALIQTLVNTKRQNVGLLITSQNIPEDHNIYSQGQRTSPYFICNRKDNGVTLLKCEPHFTQEVLDHVTSFEDVLSELKLDEVTIKEGVTSIPKYCFSNNTTIKKVNLPTTITTIGEKAFVPSRIETVNIPYGVSVIPYNCFFGCENIKDVEIPESVVEIKSMAFLGTSITDVTIPSSVKNIEAIVFNNAKNIHIKGTPSFHSNSFTLRNVESITLDSPTPPFVKIHAPDWDKNISNIIVSIPEGSYNAYSQHPFWAKLIENGKRINVNITSTKPGDFLPQLPPISDLPKIDSLTVTGFIYNTDLKILKEFKSLKYIDFSQAFIIKSPQSVEASKRQAEELQAIFGLIGMAADAQYTDGNMSTLDHNTTSAFSDMMIAMSEITEASNECYVPGGAFMNMTRLEHIKLPLRAKSIGKFAFKDCRNLKIIETPLFVEKIEEEAFSGCKSLTEIKIPASVKFLGNGLFSGCNSLEYVDLRACTLKSSNPSREGRFEFNIFSFYNGEIFMPDGITYVHYSRSPNSISGIIHFPTTLTLINCHFRDAKLYFYNQTPPALERAFSGGKITNCTIYVPKGYTIPYYNAFGNSNEYIEQ